MIVQECLYHGPRMSPYHVSRGLNTEREKYKSTHGCIWHVLLVQYYYKTARCVVVNNNSTVLEHNEVIISWYICTSNCTFPTATSDSCYFGLGICYHYEDPKTIIFNL